MRIAEISQKTLSIFIAASQSLERRPIRSDGKSTGEQQSPEVKKSHGARYSSGIAVQRGPRLGRRRNGLKNWCEDHQSWNSHIIAVPAVASAIDEIAMVR